METKSAIVDAPIMFPKIQFLTAGEDAVLTMTNYVPMLHRHASEFTKFLIARPASAFTKILWVRLVSDVTQFIYGLSGT